MNTNRESKLNFEETMAYLTFTLNQLPERVREYKLSLCLLFVNCDKKFDSVGLNAVLRAVTEEGIEEKYVEVVKEGT